MRIQKVSVIFSWVIVGLVFLFTLGVVAAIKKWIDRDWATGITELEDDQSSGVGFDNEDPFEELEPLNMDAAPIESQSSIGAENLESLEDEDPDMKKLEI